MTEPKHTPGPWRIWHDGSVVAAGDKGANGGKVIFESDAFFGPDREANIALCAAAPDLLEVAEEVLATASIETPDHLLKMATSAVRKARGENP